MSATAEVVEVTPEHRLIGLREQWTELDVELHELDTWLGEYSGKYRIAVGVDLDSQATGRRTSRAAKVAAEHDQKCARQREVLALREVLSERMAAAQSEVDEIKRAALRAEGARFEQRQLVAVQEL